MPAFSVLTLPSPVFSNGRSSIPPPSAESFDANFGGFLPERHILNSELGQTAYYLFSNVSSFPASSSPGQSKPSIRRAVLMHGGSTPCINLVPLAKAILSQSSPDDSGNDSTNSTGPPTELLLYDMWGHGLSSTPFQAPTPSLFHIQLLALLATLSWPRIHLVSFSASGALAISFAAQHPTLCLSVTLIAPTGLLRSAAVPSLTRLLRSGGPRGLWGAAARRSILSFADGGPPPVPSSDWRERVARGQPVYDMDALQLWQRECHEGHVPLLVGLYHWGGVFDMHEVYAVAARGPVGKRALVVLGEFDAVFGGETFRRELDGVGWRGDVVEVKGVGHLVVREKPVETAELLFRYWAKYEADLFG